MSRDERIVAATGRSVFSIDPGGDVVRARGMEGELPTCLAAGPAGRGPAWCGTRDGRVYRSDDGGSSWRRAGLEAERVTAVAADPLDPERVWVGTEPSTLWRSADGGATWERAEGLRELPSASEWSFPPRPETDHVRWIACHPEREGHLWLAIEAGALVTTPDGGESWRDRVAGGPRDTHEVAVHPARPETLRVAAGDGYFESEDGGSAWARPRRGLEVGYCRSVAVDPGDPAGVVISAASRAHAAYVAGRSDGRLYRRRGSGPWERVTRGWPDPPETIAPLLLAGLRAGELWAADERGLHRSEDGGRCWRRVTPFPGRPEHLPGLALVLTRTASGASGSPPARRGR